jgi:hypothetical protein
MARKDRELGHLRLGWSDPELKLQEARIAKYRELCTSANVPIGLDKYDGSKEIDFDYCGTGCSAGDRGMKGYAYLTLQPRRVLPALGGYDRDYQHSRKIFRPIGGHWYLFYVRLQ